MAVSTTGASAIYTSLGACGVSLAHLICLEQYGRRFRTPVAEFQPPIV